MKQKEDKKGQFYLVGAMIIVALLVGFATVNNFIQQEDSTKVYDLGEELGIEGDQVVEYGIINPERTISMLLNDFTSKYSNYASSSNVKIFFIFGNEKEITVLTYEELLAGSISVGDSTLQISEGTRSETKIIPIDNKVEVKLEDVVHEFELKPGENFYYVIIQETKEGSRNVIKG
jgi:hypothetical protein